VPGQVIPQNGKGENNMASHPNKRKKRVGSSHNNSNSVGNSFKGSPMGSSDIGGASQMPLQIIAKSKSKLLKG